MTGAAVLSASDRSWRGEREDLSGRLLCQLLARIPAGLEAYRVVPDRIGSIRSAMRGMLGKRAVRLLLTTGGTGVSPRDVTPEATLPLLERELPALSLAIRWASFRKAPASVISRALAGFSGDCLIVNMPGSPGAVAECFEVVEPTLRSFFQDDRRKGR
jgi:molybdenum cofactor synthesis domain-containing protein